MRTFQAGLADQRVYSEAGSKLGALGSALHSSHATEVDPPPIAERRTLANTSPSSSGGGGVPRSQTCGLGIADIVELIETHARWERICASSSMRQSDEKPREPEPDRALNWIVDPLLNRTASRLRAFMTDLTRDRSEAFSSASMISMSFANDSRA